MSPKPAAPPALGLLVREKSRAYVTPFPYTVGTECPGESLPEAREADFSPTGEVFVSIEGAELAAVIRDATTGEQIASCGGLNDPHTPLKINFATFSPLGSYLLTWSRPVIGVSVPNLVVYQVRSGERVAAFHQKLFHIGVWPSIQWSDDEAIAARSVTNTIHFFEGDKLSEPPCAKLGIPGISKFALSHGAAPYTIAAFIPGVKGAPGRIATYKHPDEGGEQLAQRSTFRADSATFKWNSKGTAVLSLISTNIDTSGKSYYGESEVYFMDNLGVVDQRVDLPQEGPTYDAAWSPTGMEFIIIYGFMPARATMFNERCEPIFDFGTGSRNTISFSPHGRFVALAGFGNLAGAVEFWDKNKQTLVGQAQLSCTTMHGWSPCSRYFLGATTFPRLRVDNCFRVVRIDGQLIHEHKMEDSLLHQVIFKPALRGVFPDPKTALDDMIGGPMQAPTSAGSDKSQQKKKTGVYRPPGSRGMASSVTLHDYVEAGKVDKVAFLSSGSGLSAAPARSSTGRKVVPGMDPADFPTGPSKAAIAKQKKKERERQVKAQKEAAAKEAAAPVKSTPADIQTVEAGEKLAKKLKKKLRAVDALKSNQAEGKELNQEQLEKLASGSALEKELAEVETRIKELSA